MGGVADTAWGTNPSKLWAEAPHPEARALSSWGGTMFKGAWFPEWHIGLLRDTARALILAPLFHIVMLLLRLEECLGPKLYTAQLTKCSQLLWDARR